MGVSFQLDRVGGQPRQNEKNRKATWTLKKKLRRLSMRKRDAIGRPDGRMEIATIDTIERDWPVPTRAVRPFETSPRIDGRR